MSAEERADLDGFEQAVFSRRYETAALLLDGVLRAFVNGRGFIEAQTPTQKHVARAAGAITALWGDPDFYLMPDAFTMACNYAWIVDALFAASEYGDTEHLQRLAAKQQNLEKLLVATPLSSRLQIDFDTIFKQAPQEMFPYWLALLSSPQVFSEEADRRRNNLLAMTKVFENVELREDVFPALLGAYMNVTYATAPWKHEPKRLFHKLTQLNRAPDKGWSKKFEVRRKDRPVLVVPVEWWTEAHAMTRVYGHAVKSLREKFHTIGVGVPGKTDSVTRAMFDEFYEPEMAPRMDLRTVANFIRERDADVIYYPSVGMNLFTVALASHRLAPIQMMSLGHPATTQSPEMDYVLIEPDMGWDPRDYSEQPAYLSSADCFRYSRHTSRKVMTRHEPRRDPEYLKVGIAAMHSKVSWPFIRALQKIRAKSPKLVQFNFFPFVAGVSQAQFARNIDEVLPDPVNVWDRAEYNRFMENLSQQDLLLFSFPFGGTNSVMDAIELGMPMVGFCGREPCARTDAVVIKRAGLPEGIFIATSEDDYVARVLRMVDDDYRRRAAGLVCDVDLESRFYADRGNRELLETIWETYRSHSS